MINKLKNILKKDKVFLMMALIIAALDSCVPTRDLKAESTKIPSKPIDRHLEYGDCQME